MESLLQRDHFTIRSKFRWFPALNTIFQVVDDQGEKLGQLVMHAVLMRPVLWLFGLLIELGLIVGGGVLLGKVEGNGAKIAGGVMVLLGLLSLFWLQFRSFLSSRAPSSLTVEDNEGNKILTARQGWAIWRPTFTVKNANDKEIGSSRQAFIRGDLWYTIWDGEDKKWGSIRRRPFGFQYRVFKESQQVAMFRRKLVDLRKAVTGHRNYILEYLSEGLSSDERALILGTVAFADVLGRQKKLRQEKAEEEKEAAKKQK